MSWGKLVEATPELARRGRERLDDAGLALLGTLREDGSPRISPIEPFFAGRDLVFGAMSWSAKARDLRRDPRCVLHSVVTDVGGSEGELKLYGRVAPVRDAAVRDAPEGAWWIGRPPGDADVFLLEVGVAVFVTWDAERGEATLWRWSRERGYRESTRTYP